jgi:hypothetical protein
VFTKLARRPPIRLPKGGIESPQAAEACRQGNLGDRQISLIQQTFRKLKTPGLRKGDRRCTHVLQKETTQMTRTQSQHASQVVDGGVVKNAFIDQAQASTDDG